MVWTPIGHDCSIVPEMPKKLEEKLEDKPEETKLEETAKEIPQEYLTSKESFGPSGYGC